MAITNRTFFALMKWLVAIAGIGSFVAFLIVAYYAAFHSSGSVDRFSDMHQISTALEQFKSKYGAYPPDHQSSAGFLAFVNKVYPHADRGEIEEFQAALVRNKKAISPAEALVLYLNYLSNDSKNPYRFAIVMASEPVNSPKPAWKEDIGPTDDLVILYEFIEGSLQDPDGDGFPEYVQRDSQNAPLIYFDARTYRDPEAMERLANSDEGSSGSSSAGFVLPYAREDDSIERQYTFYNLKSYQLISAGRDGQFGVIGPASGAVRFTVLNPNVRDDSVRVPKFDSDNTANFSGGRTFRDFLTRD